MTKKYLLIGDISENAKMDDLVKELNEHLDKFDTPTIILDVYNFDLAHMSKPVEVITDIHTIDDLPYMVDSELAAVIVCNYSSEFKTMYDSIIKKLDDLLDSYRSDNDRIIFTKNSIINLDTFRVISVNPSYNRYVPVIFHDGSDITFWGINENKNFTSTKCKQTIHYYMQKNKAKVIKVWDTHYLIKIRNINAVSADQLPMSTKYLYCLKQVIGEVIAVNDSFILAKINRIPDTLVEGPNVGSSYGFFVEHMIDFIRYNGVDGTFNVVLSYGVDTKGTGITLIEKKETVEPSITPKSSKLTNIHKKLKELLAEVEELMKE